MNNTVPLYVVILAAGKGTRMKSEKAKVLHEVYYAPMVHHVIKAVAPLNPDKIAVIVGHQRDAVKDSLTVFDNLSFVTQEEQLGTGHAVLSAEQAIPEGEGTVMILNGDSPLLKSETLREMFTQHSENDATATLMTTHLDDPSNYGRIVTDQQGVFTAIVEEKDSTPEEKTITEVNAGIYCVERNFLFEVLKDVGTDNSQGEVYLTDIVSLGISQGKTIDKFVTADSLDVLGVNSRVELAQAHDEMRRRKNSELMMSGVTMQSLHTISVSPDSTVGNDGLVMSGAQLLGTTTTGKNCVIGTGAVLENCTLGDNVKIGHYCVLTNITIPDNTVIEPCRTAIGNN